MVFALREELGTSVGTVVRVARRLGCGVESLRRWVAQAEVGAGAGVAVRFIGSNRAEFGVEPVCAALRVAPSARWSAKRRRLGLRATPR